MGYKFSSLRLRDSRADHTMLNWRANIRRWHERLFGVAGSGFQSGRNTSIRRETPAVWYGIFRTVQNVISTARLRRRRWSSTEAEQFHNFRCRGFGASTAGLGTTDCQHLRNYSVEVWNRPTKFRFDRLALTG